MSRHHITEHHGICSCFSRLRGIKLAYSSCHKHDLHTLNVNVHSIYTHATHFDVLSFLLVKVIKEQWTILLP